MDQPASTPTGITAAVTVLPAFDPVPAPPRQAKVSLLRRRGTGEAAQALQNAPAQQDAQSQQDAQPQQDAQSQLERPGQARPEPNDRPVVAVPASPLALVPPIPLPVAVAVPSAPAELPAAEPAAADLQSALRRERERADSAEAANAVLRRRLALLDDELAAFRPRAIVPFEDRVD